MGSIARHLIEVSSVFAAALMSEAPTLQRGFLEGWAKKRNDVFPKVTEFSQRSQGKPRCAILYCAEEFVSVSLVLSSEGLSRQMDALSSRHVC